MARSVRKLESERDPGFRSIWRSGGNLAQEGSDITKRIVVAMSGASGAIYGIRTLEVLRGISGIETHLVLTEASRLIIAHETCWKVEDVEALADVVYQADDLGAPIASGSYQTHGMLVAPCSTKTLSAIANSYGSTLLTRAADVHLKEGRPLVLLVRETPLHRGHLRLMQWAVENGAVIMPAVPAFYGRPRTVADIVDGIVGRALLRLGIENKLYHQWHGLDGSHPA